MLVLIPTSPLVELLLRQETKAISPLTQGVGRVFPEEAGAPQTHVSSVEMQKRATPIKLLIFKAIFLTDALTRD